MKVIDKENMLAPTTKVGQKEQIVWLDIVRLVAMFTLVCCHCANPFNWVADNSPVIADIKFWGALHGAMLRHSVPLFVMITGALLLPIRIDAGQFYKKRISRVFFPFLVWSVIYCLFPWIVGLFGGGKELIQAFFPYAGADFLTQSLNVSLKGIVMIPFNFSTIGIHMWYIYLLIGLYLYMPIFSSWVEKASEHAKLWFLAAWGITTLLPYCQYFVSPYLWGTCSWNSFGMLYYFAGFNGYLLLGHYLKKRQWSVRKLLFLGVPMFAAGYCLTYFGHKYMNGIPDHTEAMVELFWTTNSINVVLMTIPLFMACKVIKVKSDNVKKILVNLTLCGFGIYMIHYFFIGPAVLLMRTLGVHLGLQIPLAAVAAFGASWLCVAAAYHFYGKKTRWVLG
jgi:surface polysaccharide O-acyltransferase-like enzyme